MAAQSEDGLSFSFKLPSEDLALRSVAINVGIPELIFDAALKVPTLTEEDVGIACRLACEGVRPEFFYKLIPIGHPYNGRQYKHYSPQWLKGTSVGELLSEVDWTMKCLNVGARSDKAKEKFWAWKETSKLEGLATRLHFPEDGPPGSIIMSCDSVEVQKSDNELVFVQEPKMKIDCDASSSYTKYLTDIYPSIAYYDEPLFLKMQELIKLVLAAEWLKEKGVRFSQSWMTECSAPQTVSQAIEVRPTTLREEQEKEILSALEKRFPEYSRQEVFGPLSVDTNLKKTIYESGIEIKLSETSQLSVPGIPKVEWTIIARASLNDYDMLYRGMDPNMPIGYLLGLEKPIIPNVNAWSELFCETVPVPRVWIMPHCKEAGTFSAGGGVTTSTIPVTETVASAPRVQKRESVRQDQYVKHDDRQLGVLAQRQKGKKRVRKDMVPRQKKVSRPDRNVTSKTQQTKLQNQVEKASKAGYGYADSMMGDRVVCDEKGDIITKEQGYRQHTQLRVTVYGEQTSDNVPPNLEPLSLGEQPAQQQAGVTNGLFSPNGPDVSGYASISDSSHTNNSPLAGEPASNSVPPNLAPLPLGEQPAQHQVAQLAAGATNDLLSPDGSVISKDSGNSSISNDSHINTPEDSEFSDDYMSDTK